MVFRTVRPRPSRGSTDWGARQFHRVLDDEERIAAERERLLAMGWRSPQAATRPRPNGPTFDDERDAYADLIEQDFTLRRALDDEARRRVQMRTQSPIGGQNDANGLGESGKAGLVPSWAAGGRFGVPVPRGVTAESPALLRQVSLTHRTGDEASRTNDAQEYPKVAVAPAVALAVEELLLLLGVGAAGAAAQQGSQRHLDNNQFLDGFDVAPRDLAPPQQPEPPRDFDPEEARRILQRFGGPSSDIPPAVDLSPESVPIQEEVFPNILTGPNLDNPSRFPDWVENRGNERTRNFNHGLLGTTESLVGEMEAPVGHIGGARNKDRIEVKELYLPNTDTGKSAGSNYIDVAFRHDKTARRLLIQTIDTRADGSPSSREYANNVRVIRNMESGDILVLIPKLAVGEILNEEALRSFLRPLIEDLGNWSPEDDLRSSTAPDQLWRYFRNVR